MNLSQVPTASSPLPTNKSRSSLLAWPAWLRMLALAPLLTLLWLAVYWARNPAQAL